MPNRDLELFHLTRFLDVFGLELDAAPVHSDSPDFLVELNGRHIGIEHTQFFLPPEPGDSPQQQLDALQELAVEQAQRLFHAAGGPALYVSVQFDHGRTPSSKAQAYDLGKRLASVVRRNGWPASPEEATFEPWRDLPEVCAYSVMNSVDGVDELWQGGSGGWVAPVGTPHVEAVLAAKGARYQRYAERAADHWLLIVNDPFRGGTPCQISEGAATARYTFPFDRAFWFQYPYGPVTELHRSPIVERPHGGATSV